MERNSDDMSPRALAYVLSKPIAIETLDAVSGGGSAMGIQWSSKETLTPSGSSVNNVDVVIDASIDW